jgi:TRAP-type C4-dicarboxylate transport system permease small subunit
MLRWICSLIDRISHLFGLVGAGIVGILAILLSYDVFMRFVMNNPTDWVLDITQLFQAALAFLATSYVLKIGGHVNMNVLPTFVNNQWKKRLAIVSSILTAIGSGWMAYLCWRLFTKSLMIREASYSLNIPLYPWKFLVPFGFLLLALQSISLAVEYFSQPPERFSETKEEM